MSLCSNSTPFSRSAIQGRCANGQTPEFQRTMLLEEEKLFTNGRSTASERKKMMYVDVCAMVACASLLMLAKCRLQELKFRIF